MADKSYEQKYEELQTQFKSLEVDYGKLKVEKDKLANYLPIMEHDADFWFDIQDKLMVSDPDGIKDLVKSKKMTLNDRDPENHRTLLLMAAVYGHYEIVQFCINSGADLHVKDRHNRTPLDCARLNGYYNVEQVLLFAELNVNLGNEIKERSEVIHTQNGIIDIILNELDLIGEQSKELFEKILMELMINIINKRMSFDDDLLNLCWVISCRQKDPFSSDLWRSITTQCEEIVADGNKRDWYWMKKVLLPSTIWFKQEANTAADDIDNKEDQEADPRFLYFRLLKIVDIGAQNQLNKLEQDLKNLAEVRQDDWNQLVTYSIPQAYPVVRQDLIPNGIVSQHTYEELLESVGAAFSPPQFYEYNQYLSHLVLLSQTVDDDFQKSVMEIYGINRVTHDAVIDFKDRFDESKTEIDDKVPAGDGQIKYIRGPVKQVDRARAKAQNDYVDEDYPATACVIDLNRCCLLFNDISTLLRAVQIFVRKVRYYQSGHIIAIARLKNTFIDYARDGAQYADIKLNVVINGKHNNIVGEVQFLLQIMKNFKNKAHNLYAIQRKRESIENSVVKMLPIMLDKERRLFKAGISGNVNDLCKVLVIDNVSAQGLMREKKRFTIMHRICTKDRERALLFVRSLLSKQEFLEHLFKPNHGNKTPMEYCILFSSMNVVKRLFVLKEVREAHQKDDTLYRSLYYLFVFNRNKDLVDFIFSSLQISKEKFAQLLFHRCPKPDDDLEFMSNAIMHHRDYIMHDTIMRNRDYIFEKLVERMEQKTFIKNALQCDGNNINAVEMALQFNRIKIVEAMFAVKAIKEEYMKNTKLLWRALFYLFSFSKTQQIRDYVLKEFDAVKDTFGGLIGKRYSEADGKFEGKFQHKAWRYENYSIVASIPNHGAKVENLQHLRAVVGEKAFCDSVFVKDASELNAIQIAIEKGCLEIVKFILSEEVIKKRCVEDKKELKCILSALNTHFDASIAQQVVKKLELTKNQLKEFKEDTSKILDVLY